jgi:endonuclease/exonuclease/phosphatase family metal-dependent hydrolase
MRPVTGLAARLRPHLAGSWEGGGNLILVRTGRPGTEIVSHQRAVIARRPERRVVSLAVTSGGLCLANLHASTGERASGDVLEAARLAVDWAGDSPLVLGGDFNVRPAGSGVFGELERSHGLTGTTAPDAIDHLLVRGATILDPPVAWPDARRDVPDPGTGLMLRLSDHAPVVSRIAA